jgi:ATP-binding cassette subfamily C protein CydCD
LGVAAVAFLQACLVVGQAFAVAGTVVAVVEGTPLAPWLAFLLGLTLGRSAAALAGDLLAARAAGSAGRALRHTLLDAELHADPAVGRSDRGEVATLATRGVAALEPYLTRYLPALLLAATLPMLTVLVMASQDIWSALIVIATIPLVPLFAALVGWRTQARAQRQWRAMASLAGYFIDVVRGLPTLVAFRRAEAQVDRIRAISHQHRRATLDTLRYGFASSAVLELVATISVALVAVSVGLRLQAGSLDLYKALVVLLLAPEAYWPLRRVGAEFHAAAEGLATFVEVRNRLPSQTASRSDASGSGEPGGEGVDAGTARIVLDRVTVRYPGRTRPALANASGVIEPRSVVAISGPSGIGKSTLLRVLRGDLSPSVGAVTVAGVPLATLDAQDWRRQVAWQPQRPWLMAGTIADNVRLGRADASDAEVWDALRLVHLAEVVTALPGGLAAEVTEDGGNLSAGERARLSLARVVVSKRPVALLDEPTAHLDAETEQVILDALRWLSGRATVVVVAHRRAVLSIADTVIELRADAPGPGTSPADTEVTVLRAAGGSSAGDHEPHIWAGGGGGEASAPPVSPAVATVPPMERVRGRGRVDQHVGRRLWLAAWLGALAAVSGVALTATAGWLIVRASQHPPVLMLVVAIVGVRTFGIARPVFRYAERLVGHDAALRGLAETRARAFAALIPLTPGRLGRRRGDLLATVVDDVDAYVDQRLRVWLPVATAAVAGGLTIAICSWMLPGAGAVTSLLVAVGGLGAFALSGAVAAQSESRAIDQRAQLSDQVVQLLDGVDNVLAWGAEDRFAATIAETGRRLAKSQLLGGLATGLGRALAVFAAGSGVALMSWTVQPGVGAGQLSAPVAALLVLVPLGLAETLQQLPEAGALRARTGRALQRLEALEHTAPAVLPPDQPRQLPAGPMSVELEKVAAGWRDHPVVTGLDLDLPAGHRMAIVGPSGSGKSTVAAVLMRFLDPLRGQVRLAGQDLLRVTPDDVHRVVGLVDDEPHIFASTLAENVRLARPGASDSEVATALRAAQLGAWLDALPDGLDSWLGEGGAGVSGGERARLAMARSLLADQPVLVLDEPVAHLDSSTAELVLQRLLTAAEGRTTVLISHRREGLDEVDQVLNLVAAASPTLVAVEAPTSRG